MNMLEVSRVSKSYAGHTALNDVSIQVPVGSVFGLLGPNGAGKTSLIRIITCITIADSGTVTFNGEPLAQHHSRMMGYLPEERGLYKKMEVSEHLLYLARLRGLSRHEALQRVRTWTDRFDLKPWLHKKVEELSKGMQQKVQFISTVLHDPKLIILDEPFSGFDPINATMVMEEIRRLKQEGTTVIFSTHRMESVEQLCDHFALINRSKKVLDGSVADVRKQFSNNQFEVTYSGATLPSSLVYEIIAVDEGSAMSKAQIRSTPGLPSNELLKELISHVEVHGFVEQVPSMHDIFVQVVGETA